MKLEEIGFYTLSDERALNSNERTSIKRAEVIITSRCNFRCPYCRGTDINGDRNADMSLYSIKKTIDLLARDKIENIRFSGGEPCLHKNIESILRYTKKKCKELKHMAISTNGSLHMDRYRKFIKLGVNDFSISLDACCSKVGDKMAGGIQGAFDTVTANIKEISKLTYVTVGVVVDKDNVTELNGIVKFADSLGVSDIRLISSAQTNDINVFNDLVIEDEYLNKYPILRYRYNHFKIKRNVRGILDTDSTMCGLMLDDLIIKGKYHYPCVIKMREGCEPIGKMNKDYREQRLKHFQSCNTHCDKICKQNCLDVCIDHNNKWDSKNKA